MTATRGRRPREPRRSPRLLGVLLCYNDGDLVADAIEYLIDQGHHVIVWDHGSSDETPRVIDHYRADLLEAKTIPRECDFYNLYLEMSHHLLANYVDRYEWISWPDQDEFLEGPDRSRSYRDAVLEVLESPYDWVQFRNFNFWWTTADDDSIVSPIQRVKHYSLFQDCGPRIRAWRASATNERHFNHNAAKGERFPTLFNLRHYPMRSEVQMTRRIESDRAGLRRGRSNYHYENMRQWRDRLFIPPEVLHVDDGGELDLLERVDWRSIYGDEQTPGSG